MVAYADVEACATWRRALAVRFLVAWQVELALSAALSGWTCKYDNGAASLSSCANRPCRNSLALLCGVSTTTSRTRSC
eukprot:scaffold93044_cov62-Phaeocystis_antarctica.AAC.5